MEFLKIHFYFHFTPHPSLLIQIRIRPTHRPRDIEILNRNKSIPPPFRHATIPLSIRPGHKIRHPALWNTELQPIPGPTGRQLLPRSHSQLLDLVRQQPRCPCSQWGTIAKASLRFRRLGNEWCKMWNRDL